MTSWQKRFVLALWVGSASFAAGQIIAETVYKRLTGGKPCPSTTRP